MSEPTYTISADGKSITCHRCGRTSWNGNDVREKFCGRCNAFHQDVGAQGLTRPPQKLDSANHFEVVLTSGDQVALRWPMGSDPSWRHFHWPEITKAQAVNLAVWLKAIADPNGEEFARVEKEVRST